jgi:hypothetical protein
VEKSRHDLDSFLNLYYMRRPIFGGLLFASINYYELPPAIRRRFRGQRGRYSERGVNELSNTPSPIGNADGLRWRGADGFVDTAEVIVRHVQSDRRDMVIQLL